MSMAPNGEFLNIRKNRHQRRRHGQAWPSRKVSYVTCSELRAINGQMIDGTQRYLSAYTGPHIGWLKRTGHHLDDGLAGLSKPSDTPKGVTPSRLGRAFLISRSVLGPAPQRWRAGGGKQKQKTKGGPGARHEKPKKYPPWPLGPPWGTCERLWELWGLWGPMGPHGAPQAPQRHDSLRRRSAAGVRALEHTKKRLFLFSTQGARAL